MDPRGQALKRHATHMLQFKPGRDVALLTALLNVIIAEDLTDQQYVQAHTEDFDAAQADSVKDRTPEAMAEICGIDADDAAHRGAANTPAPRPPIIFWGMGISQHVHGTDNARCLIALALVTGQVGRPGTGLHPLRGQNNVQGASDAGLIPMFYPDYQSVEKRRDAASSTRQLWGTPLDRKRGLTVVEIMNAIHDGEIRGMYIMGENPAMSDPDVQHAREALAKLEHLVVQDIFLTETARYADVVLPASAWPEKTGTVTNTNRQVQLGRQRAAAAGRGARGFVDHPGDRAAPRPRLALRPSQGRLRRDEAGDAVARQHHLGAARARELGHLSLRRRGPARQRHRLRRRLPDRQRRAAELVPVEIVPPGRGARRGLSDGAHHRAASSSIGTPAP